jgi:hypothetical protein
MTTAQLKKFIAENKEAITARVNEYTAACNIKISEFTGEQKQRLILSLFANEIAKAIKA